MLIGLIIMYLISGFILLILACINEDDWIYYIYCWYMMIFCSVVKKIRKFIKKKKSIRKE